MLFSLRERPKRIGGTWVLSCMRGSVTSLTIAAPPRVQIPEAARLVAEQPQAVEQVC
jgi:hypothetical protein